MNELMSWRVLNGVGKARSIAVGRAEGINNFFLELRSIVRIFSFVSGRSGVRGSIKGGGVRD